MKKHSLVTLTMSAALLVAVAACSSQPGGTEGGETQGSGETEPFTFILDFLPNGEHAAYFAALDQGWYEEEGLEVEIIRGNGSGDTVSRVAAGQGDAGSADFSAIVASVANQDAPVVAIASYLRRPPHSIFMQDGSGIDTPADLEGKTIGTTAGNSNQILFPLFAELAGFDDSTVKWTTMDAASLGPSLIQGSVDASVFFAGHMPRVAAQAEEQGVTLHQFPYAEYGIEVYSLSVFSHLDTVEGEPEKLEGFVRATMRGLEFVSENEENMESAVTKIIELNPEVDYDAVLGAAQIYQDYVLTEEIANGDVDWGEWEPERVEDSRDTYVEYLDLNRVVDIDDLYTNDIVAP